MKKRVAIFSPELKDREELGVLLERYFKKNFEGYFSQIEFQKYSHLGEPIRDNQLGHWNSGEAFVVFDRRLCSQKSRFKSVKSAPYYKALRASYEMSKGLCDKKGIPYVTYEGEITKKQPGIFIAKIENIKGKIRGRLEEKVQ